MSEADVIVADELAGTEILQLARQDCNVIHVGKRGGRASSAKQTDINEILSSHCQEGTLLVRPLSLSLSPLSFSLF